MRTMDAVVAIGLAGDAISDAGVVRPLRAGLSAAISAALRFPLRSLSPPLASSLRAPLAGKDRAPTRELSSRRMPIVPHVLAAPTPPGSSTPFRPLRGGSTARA